MILVQPMRGKLPSILRGPGSLRVSDPDHLDGLFAGSPRHPHIDEIEVKPSASASRSRLAIGMATAGFPHGRKGKDADEITDAPLKPRDLLRGRALHLHVSVPSKAA